MQNMVPVMGRWKVCGSCRRIASGTAGAGRVRCNARGPARAQTRREQCRRARRLAHAHAKSAFRDIHSHKCKQLPIFKQNPFIANLGRSINNANRWAVVL